MVLQFLFETTITTYGSVPMGLSAISVSNNGSTLNGVSVTPTLTNTFIPICDNNNVCIGKKSKTITVTITNNTGSAINTQNLAINFTFAQMFTVSYNNDGVIGDYVISGGTFTYTFQSNAPTSVTVTSGTYGTPSMSGNTLTIPNVTSNLVITGTSGPAGSGTWADPYQLNDTTYHYADLDAGSYKFLELPGEPEITVDASGKVTKYELTNCGSEGVTFSGQS